MKETQMFVSDALNSIDFVNPHNGRSCVYGHTLEQIQQRYPGAYIADIDTWIANKEKALCTPPEPTTEEQYENMLEVLPPQNWVQRGGNSTFEMCEHTSGRVTAIYARVDGNYYALSDIAGTPHDNIVAACRRRAALDRLFIGVFPGGIAYCDRGIQEDGDYKRLAFLPYDTLKLEWRAQTITPEMRAHIQQDADELTTKRGQTFPTSATGQTVLLGSAL